MQTTTFITPKITVSEIAVSLVTDNNALIEVYFTEESGKVVTRQKLNTLTNVWHPGIVIGTDKYNRRWVAHNHYKYGRPVFELYDLYLKGQQGIWDNRRINYDRKEIIKRTIDEVQQGKAYDKYCYNCQTFVNLIAQGSNQSEAVDKISDGAILLGASLTLLGTFTRNKTLIYTGSTVAAVGAGAKMYSRTKK